MASGYVYVYVDNDLISSIKVNWPVSPGSDALVFKVNENNLQYQGEIIGYWYTIWTAPEGADFQGFSTSSGGSVVYATGDTFPSTSDASIYLYSVINYDLTGTRWRIVSFDTKRTQGKTYNINYKYGGVGYNNPTKTTANFSSFSLDGAGPSEEEYYYTVTLSGVCSDINGKSGITPSDYVSWVDGYIIINGVYQGTTVYMYSNETEAPWGDGKYISDSIIEILGGTDVSDPDLNAWLGKNAVKLPPKSEPFVITYNGENVYGSDEDCLINFPCVNKIMASDITVIGSNLYNVNIKYNGSTITTGGGNFTKTLKCSGEIMNSDIEIKVQKEEPLPEYNYCIDFRVTDSDGPPTDYSLATINNTKNWDGTIEYSYNKRNWHVWDGTDKISFTSKNHIYLRGSNNTYITGGSNRQFTILSLSSKSVARGVSCTGNLENLLDSETVATGNHPTMSNYCFAYLFQDFPLSGIAPELPGTTLKNYCYNYMFYNCTNLISPPALPATTLQDGCYFGMFSNCSSLNSAPALPATVLANSCYRNMFSYCTSLTSAPALPATYLTINGTSSGTKATYCYYNMFIGCSSLTSAPALPATVLSDYCYGYMFRLCTSLTATPALPATTLQVGCYYYMFGGCTSLTAITRPAGQTRDLPATTIATSAYSYMFIGCSNLQTGPVFTVSSTNSNCCSSMFEGCSSLTTIPTLSATTIATSAYSYMFYGCKSLTTAPTLPATSLNNSCYSNMFAGCTSLNSIPRLRATTLKNYCYQTMFSGCSNIKISTSYSSSSYPNTYRIPYSGTGSTATSALSGMFTNTGGTFTGTPSINTNYYTSNTIIS